LNLPALQTHSVLSDHLLSTTASIETRIAADGGVNLPIKRHAALPHSVGHDAVDTHPSVVGGLCLLEGGRHRRIRRQAVVEFMHSGPVNLAAWEWTGAGVDRERFKATIVRVERRGLKAYVFPSCASILVHVLGQKITATASAVLGVHHLLREPSLDLVVDVGVLEELAAADGVLLRPANAR